MHTFPPGSPQNSKTHTTMPQDWQTAFANTWKDTNTENQSTLNCIFQPTRSPHVSSIPDPLPFANKSETQTIFATLRLPSSYFQIAHGTAGSAQAHITRCQHQHPAQQPSPDSYEFIAHYNTRLGDWALALSHDVARRATSVFWSVDEKLDPAALLEDFEDFKQYALHPLLIPVIMFAANLRVNEGRQRSIKARVQGLEGSIRRVVQREASSSPSSSSSSPSPFDQDAKAFGEEQAQFQNLEAWFRVLHSCRTDQASRKRRYRFWRGFVESLEEGFKYVEELMALSPDAHLLEAQRELRRWVDVNSQKLEGLKARDEDHVDRVENVSHMVSFGL